MNCTSITSFHECYTPKVWNYPNITRPFSIIYYALGGSAFYTVDEEEHPFKKGHLYILPANRLFSLREDPKDKFFSVYIHAFTSPEITTVTDVDVENHPFIKDTLELVRKYAKERNGRNKVYIKKLTDMLLSYIFDESEDDDLIIQVRRYIDKNFVSVFCTNNLSDRFNYSNSYLSKLFRKQYNVTPKQYAKQLLLSESASLLAKGLSVNKVSEQLEFSSPENFSRFFKKCYGYSPIQYKKRFKNFPV